MPELKRNTADSLLRVGAPNLPRTRHQFPTKTHTTSARHGDIIPFLCMPVYPGDSFRIDSNWFCKADTSVRVPLDDINLDIYYFFVPYRLLDENFAKVLGDVDPYDTTAYAFPILDITNLYDADAGDQQLTPPNLLLNYLGWNHAPRKYFASGMKDRISPYPLAAYWQIINDYFRDENLDPIMDYKTYLYNATIDFSGLTYYNNVLSQDVKLLDPTVRNRYMYPMRANKLSDPMTRGMISPQFGDAIRIPAASFAWLSTHPNGELKTFNSSGAAPIFGNNTPGIESDAVGLGLSDSGLLAFVYDTSYEDGANDGYVLSSDLGINLKQELGTIQELQLAFNLQGLRYKQMKYGHRYIEQIHGLWGIDLPDVLVGRAEYLGGTMTSLNNVPVMSTQAASLGEIAGNSSTLFNDGGFFKSFGEYGLIMGLATTRVHHRYTQGKDNTIFSLFDELDLYYPPFANLGPEGNMRSNIYNLGNSAGIDKIFNYIESWTYLRQSLDRVSGIFNPNAPAVWDEFRKYWSYADIYDTAPSFNATWLKEDASNVRRTMSGRLIPYAPAPASDISIETHCAPQYLFSIYSHITKTAILPAHANPDFLFGRL